MPRSVESAILLAGGRSRRMGRDKAALPFGDRPLAEVLYDRLTRVFREVVVVAPFDGPDPVPGALTVRDRTPDQGPLEGLAVGLAALTTDRALVLACDMPFVEVPLLQFLAAQPDDAEAIVPVSHAGLESLLAVYAKRALPSLEAALVRGEHRVQSWVTSLDLREIPEPTWRPYDPEGCSFFNLNRPADYTEALTRWHLRNP